MAERRRRTLEPPAAAAPRRFAQSTRESPEQGPPGMLALQGLAGNRAVCRLLQGGSAPASIQRLVSMKDSYGARRTTGNARDLRKEVRDTITGADLADINSTRSQLHTSLTNREEELGRRKDKDSVAWKRHEARVVLERELRGLLDDEIRKLTPKPAAKPAPKPKATPAPQSSNPYALLGEL